MSSQGYSHERTCLSFGNLVRLLFFRVKEQMMDQSFQNNIIFGPPKINSHNLYVVKINRKELAKAANSIFQMWNLFSFIFCFSFFEKWNESVMRLHRLCLTLFKCREPTHWRSIWDMKHDNSFTGEGIISFGDNVLHLRLLLHIFHVSNLIGFEGTPIMRQTPPYFSCFPIILG